MDSVEGTNLISLVLLLFLITLPIPITITIHTISPTLSTQALSWICQQ